MKNEKPKKFKILSAISIADDSILRDEKIGNVLNENVKREYKFTINPSLIPDTPLIFILPKSDATNYHKTLLEAVSGLGNDISVVLEDNLNSNIIQTDLELKLCEISKLMYHIVSSNSWKNNKLNELDKNDINKMIDDLKF